MAIISGSVLFNVNNEAPLTGTGFSNVPVVLQNTTSNVGLIVLSDSSGNFAFNNVPDGNYRLVEAYGTSGGIATPGDFGTAAVISAPTPKDPLISVAPSPPATSTRVHSLSPNTILLTVAGADITGQNFVDGPVSDKPITKYDVIITPQNLVTIADNGTFGTLAAGSDVMTEPATAPYSGIATGFTYKTGWNIQDGEYTIVNIWRPSTFLTYFRTADHTTGDETGRFIFVNGSTTGAILFSEQVTLKANTYYLLSTWVMNFNYFPGSVLPQLGIKLLGAGGAVIFNVVLQDVSITAIPTWKENGTLLNSLNNTTATLQIYSNGPSAGGNDYLIDDILLQEASVATVLQGTETVSLSIADVSNEVTYTVGIKNIGQGTASNIRLVSTIPNGMSFKTNSVTVNGTTATGFNPNSPGFTLTNSIPSGQTTTVTFKATIDTVPNPNPAITSTLITYDIDPVPGGAIITQNINTNTVSTQVNNANLTYLVKSVDKNYAECGNNLTYTIGIPNIGSVAATNVVFKDTIPTGTVLVANSVTLNGSVLIGANPQSGINVGTISAGGIATITFTVTIQC